MLAKELSIQTNRDGAFGALTRGDVINLQYRQSLSTNGTARPFAIPKLRDVTAWGTSP
jgi:hypothetical protein